MRKPIPYSPIKLALSRSLRLDAAVATSFEAEHALVLATLDQLEALADGLPRLPPRPVLESLIIHLREGIPAHCRHEEHALTLNEVEQNPDSVALSRRALLLIRDEHADNEAIGLELAEHLEDCLDAAVAPAPEALGQLTRQFFLLMRRHMAWEEFVLELASAERGSGKAG